MIPDAAKGRRWPSALPARPRGQDPRGFRVYPGRVKGYREQDRVDRARVRRNPARSAWTRHRSTRTRPNGRFDYPNRLDAGTRGVLVLKYTEAIGEDLGIFGDESDFDPREGKPDLELRLVSGNMVEVRWGKGDYPGIRLECDRGAGWQFLAIATRPHYTDTTPGPAPGVSVLCKYRAIYLHEDAPVGMGSDTEEIAISGA